MKMNRATSQTLIFLCSALNAFGMVYFVADNGIPQWTYLGVTLLFLQLATARGRLQITTITFGYFITESILMSWGLVHSGTSLFHLSWGLAAGSCVVMSTLAVVPMLLLLQVWFSIVRRIGDSYLMRLSLVPFFIYVNDSFMPQLWPLAHITYFSMSENSLRQLFSFLGSNGTAFFMHLIMALIVASGLLLVTDKKKKMAATLALTAIVATGGMFALSTHEREKWQKSDKALRMLLTQPNFAYDSSRGKDSWSPQQKVFFESWFKDFEQAAKLPIDLAILPETQFLGALNSNDEMAIAVRKKTAELKIPLLVGAELTTYEGEAYNSLTLLNRNGEIEHSHLKILLIPFGEYKPFSFLPGRADYNFGGTLLDAVHPFEGVSYGMLICYEDIFTKTFVSLVQQGAEVITSVSSDNLFGESRLPLGHTMVASARALEVRRPFVRLVTSGISVAMAASGEMIARSPLREKWSQIITLPVITQPPLTNFVKYETAFPWIFLALTLLLAAASLLYSRRRLKKGPPL